MKYTIEDFNKRLDVLLSDDEISDKEIKADINNMLEALFESKVNSITDEMIDFKANINYPSLDRSHQTAFKRGYRCALKDLNKNS